MGTAWAADNLQTRQMVIGVCFVSKHGLDAYPLVAQDIFLCQDVLLLCTWAKRKVQVPGYTLTERNNWRCFRGFHVRLLYQASTTMYYIGNLPSVLIFNVPLKLFFFMVSVFNLCKHTPQETLSAAQQHAVDGVLRLEQCLGREQRKANPLDNLQ